MDDFQLFLYNLSQYKTHVWKVFKAFLKAGLYTKLSKCLISVRCILFLGFILKDKRVKMKKNVYL